MNGRVRAVRAGVGQRRFETWGEVFEGVVGDFHRPFLLQSSGPFPAKIIEGSCRRRCMVVAAVDKKLLFRSGSAPLSRRAWRLRIIASPPTTTFGRQLSIERRQTCRVASLR